MTPPIPVEEAIRGLVEALRGWQCFVCGGAGNIVIAQPGAGPKPILTPSCERCEGTGLHLAARVALAAFERRAPLRDDRTLRSIVGSYIPVGPGGEEARQQFVDDLLRAIDSALFGTAAPDREPGR